MRSPTLTRRGVMVVRQSPAHHQVMGVRTCDYRQRGLRRPARRGHRDVRHREYHLRLSKWSAGGGMRCVRGGQHAITTSNNSPIPAPLLSRLPREAAVATAADGPSRPGRHATAPASPARLVRRRTRRLQKGVVGGDRERRRAGEGCDPRTSPQRPTTARAGGSACGDRTSTSTPWVRPVVPPSARSGRRVSLVP